MRSSQAAAYGNAKLSLCLHGQQTNCLATICDWLRPKDNGRPLKRVRLLGFSELK